MKYEIKNDGNNDYFIIPKEYDGYPYTDVKVFLLDKNEQPFDGYLLIGWDYEDSDVFGVYKTKEAAIKDFDEYLHNHVNELHLLAEYNIEGFYWKGDQ